MSPAEYTRLLPFVRQAGQKAKELRAAGLEIKEKEPGDFVTNVDRALDGLLSAQLRQWFPADAVIGEENPRSRQAWQQEFPHYWFVDPIDGTNDFVEGRDDYAVMVGLLRDREPVMGWIYAPERDRLFWGGSLASGVFQCVGDGDPVPLTPQQPDRPLARIVISDKDARRYGDCIRAVVPEAEFYSLGSFGLKVMEVVLGRAGAYFYLNRRVKLWDTVGPLAIAKAAGLTCCDLQGNPLSFERAAIDPDTLIHHQPAIIGWPECLAVLLPPLAETLVLQQVSV